MSATVVQSYESVRLAELVEHPANPREGDVGAIHESIVANGFYGALIVQRSTGRILAGNHRYKAALAAGMTELPALLVDVDDDTATRILLVDNRTNDLASYDEPALLKLLVGMDDLTGTGYVLEDVDDLLNRLKINPDPQSEDDDDEPIEPPLIPVTKPGDVWSLGPHRVVCGDCRDKDVLAGLFEGRRAAVVVTSPPYASQRKYDETSGFAPIPSGEYGEWWTDVARAVWSVLADDGSFFVNIKEHTEDGERDLYVRKLVIRMREVLGWKFLDEFAWVRCGFPGKFPNRFKNGFEPIFHFAKVTTIKFRPESVAVESENAFVYDPSRSMSMTGEGYRVSGARTFETGKALPSNVLHVGAGGDGSHSAAYPTALPAFFVGAFSDRGDVIFDPFMGSGSTLIAAHKENRVGLGTEISPGYVDVICRRYQKFTGDLPVLVSTGEPHDFAEDTDNG